MPEIYPLKITLFKNKKKIKIKFSNKETFIISAELLRVESPSAEVQGHAPNQKKTPSGKSNIKIENIEPIGNYAIAIKFDDGHSTGIFSWDYLRKLSENKITLWENYLKRIKDLKLSR